jgi:enoyl-CoA hydratase
METKFIIVEPAYATHIALIRLNRPNELNALNLELMGELRDSLKALDSNDEVRVIIITGNERAFAAGADIKQMADKNVIDVLKIDQFSTWDQIKRTKKPIIAAVSGFCFGWWL